MSQIITYQDVRRARERAGLSEAARYQARAAAEKRLQGILRDNPQIGVRMRAGKPMYYTYPAGGVYREARDPAVLAKEAEG